MTTQKIYDKMNALEAEMEDSYNELKERVNEFVKDVLGDEFCALRITVYGFDVALVRDGDAVFGCGFEVRVEDKWFLDEPTIVTMNIGTCGSFEIGNNDDQEKKYMAFARTMSMLPECGMDKYLIRSYEHFKRTNKAIDKLERGLN